MARCPAHGHRIQQTPSEAVNLFGATPQPDCRRTAVAELIQTTQQALGRASEALARIFLSLEASQVPELAEEFLAFLRGKGLSRQRLSCIRIAARVRAELQASSRLDSALVSRLLALGDDLLQVYSRLTDQTKEKAHAIIQAEGRISRQQLRQLQAEPDLVPFKVSPVSAATSEAAPVSAASFVSEAVSEPEAVSDSVSDSGRCFEASSEPEASSVPEPVAVPVEPVSEAVPVSEDLTPSFEAVPVSEPVPAFPPIRGIEDIRDRIRSVGLNSDQILMAATDVLKSAATDVLKSREINIFSRQTRDQLQGLASIIDKLDREYHHHMR